MSRRPASQTHLAERQAWSRGHGAIRHTPLTRRRVAEMVAALGERAEGGHGPGAWEVLHAADRVASAGMWLVVHETYARTVQLDGRPLEPDDFKPVPEGHTGGSLNMVPAYTGYMAVNALSGTTRAWLMGQGHCVAAVDSVHQLLDNVRTAHAVRFDLSDAGKVIFGPAARALPQLPITVDDEGYLVARSGFTEPVGPSFWERDSE